MKEINIRDFYRNLEMSLEGITNEVNGNPPERITEVYKQALETIVVNFLESPALGEGLGQFKKIDLRDGADSPISRKIQNVLFHPIDWLDIGWKAASVSAAIPTFGAWTAVGFILVIRDLLKLFSIELSLMQGQIIHVLATEANKDKQLLEIDDLTKIVNETYGTSYGSQHIEKSLDELSKLKCISYERNVGSVKLLEEVSL